MTARLHHAVVYLIAAEAEGVDFGCDSAVAAWFEQAWIHRRFWTRWVVLTPIADIDGPVLDDAVEVEVWERTEVGDRWVRSVPWRDAGLDMADLRWMMTTGGDLPAADVPSCVELSAMIEA